MAGGSTFKEPKRRKCRWSYFFDEGKIGVFSYLYALLDYLETSFLKRLQVMLFSLAIHFECYLRSHVRNYKDSNIFSLCIFQMCWCMILGRPFSAGHVVPLP